MKECGACTLCCRLLEVKPLAKPANTECNHCDNGCKLYKSFARPRMCHEYTCAWLFNPVWPDSLRPDRCGVVFEPCGEKLFLANVDPNKPEAWQHGAANAAILKIMEAGCSVIVVIGEIKHVLLTHGQTPNMVWNKFETEFKRTHDMS